MQIEKKKLETILCEHVENNPRSEFFCGSLGDNRVVVMCERCFESMAYYALERFVGNALKIYLRSVK